MLTSSVQALRVLVVEDDPPSGARLTQLLREDGYEAELALDGATAITRLRRSPPMDVLVADYRLPGIDGLEVAAAGRRLQPGIGVIMLTSYSDVVERVVRRDNLQTAVLAKPVVYEDLVRELERVRRGEPALLS